MKRTLSIFLSIAVLLSLFLMPTTVSAQGDKVDTKNAISVNVGSTKYKTTINNVDEENEYKTFKITADTTGIYKFYTTYNNHIATDASLYKSDNLSKDSYIIKRRISSFYSSTPFPIYYLLKKGETVYMEISALCANSPDTDYQYTFYAEKESNCSYKNGVIYKYEESTKNYYVLSNYLSKKQSVTIESKIKGYPVTYIEKNAFYNCKFITSVNIPSSIKELRLNAFCDCTYLNSVQLSNGLTKICEGGIF